jgi:hypothetical protein
MKRYYITKDAGGYVQVPSGQPVTIPGLEDREIFTHAKFTDGRFVLGYGISDAKTGGGLTRGHTFNSPNDAALWLAAYLEDAIQLKNLRDRLRNAEADGHITPPYRETRP